MYRPTVLFIVFALMMVCSMESGLAQAYSMEVGVAPGGSFYMGNANQKTLFKDTRPSMNLLYRYNLNGRFSIKGLAGVSGIAGSTKGQVFNFPPGVELNFKRRVFDASAQLEFNFYEFGMPDYIIGSTSITPYICAGIGILGMNTTEFETAAFVPMGLGLKWKVAKRYNLGCEWTFRKTYTDKLDYVINSAGFQLSDPWLVESSRNKNKDWYSVFTMNLSIDLVSTGSKCFE